MHHHTDRIVHTTACYRSYGKLAGTTDETNFVQRSKENLKNENHKLQLCQL